MNSNEAVEAIRKINVILNNVDNEDFENLNSRGKDIIWAVSKIVGPFDDFEVPKHESQ